MLLWGGKKDQFDTAVAQMGIAIGTLTKAGASAEARRVDVEIAIKDLRDIGGPIVPAQFEAFEPVREGMIALIEALDLPENRFLRDLRATVFSEYARLAKNVPNASK